MAKALGNFVKGIFLAFIAFAVAPIMALSQLVESLSSFIG